MKKINYKTSYITPTVEVLQAKVESGMQTSNVPENGTRVSTSQYGSDSWDTPNPSNAQYS